MGCFATAIYLSLSHTCPLTLLSFFVISLWKALLTREYDLKVLELEDEEDVILRKIETMMETARSAPNSRCEKPQEESQNTVMKYRLRATVEL